jgi:hypothetical protein
LPVDIVCAFGLLRGMAISYLGLKEESKIFPKGVKKAKVDNVLNYLVNFINFGKPGADEHEGQLCAFGKSILGK